MAGLQVTNMLLKADHVTDSFMEAVQQALTARSAVGFAAVK